MRKDELDRRVQRTRQALQEALIELIVEKGFERVTVQDVIERANIGRSTFYSHFKDTEDLFLSGFENLWSLFQGHLVNRQKSSVWELSQIVFEHAQSYTEIYRALVGKQGGSLMLAHMHRYVSVLIRDALKAQWHGSKPVPLEIAVHHLTSSLLALLAWWVDHDLPHSPQHMNTMYQRLTQPGIEAILE